jgi:hypothetical protein
MRENLNIAFHLFDTVNNKLKQWKSDLLKLITLNCVGY